MFKVLNKQILARDVKRVDISAPEIAGKVLPGQFVIVTPTDRGERIPLSVADFDAGKGTIVLIFQEAGFSTRQLGDIPIGQEVFSILGPLGQPAHVVEEGVALCVMTSFGPAQQLAVCRALKNNGVRILSVIGARTKKEVMLETQMRLLSHRIHIATEDGSQGKKGMATDMVREILNENTVDVVYASGSTEMMEEVSGMTRDKDIRTWVSLNPVMVDGTGLCGSCRVKISGEEVLACMDGPVFDGHKVDYPYLKIRMRTAGEPREAQEKAGGLLGRLMSS